jgi:hypothetical protein
MRQIVSEAKEFASYFVDWNFTTEESAVYPQVKAVVEFLREPLQTVITLESSIEPSECSCVTRFFETCAVWSISADIDPAPARPLLHTINARVHRCVEMLDKVAQQHNLLEQLRQKLVDSDNGLTHHDSTPARL